jgi:hypothetical protein
MINLPCNIGTIVETTWHSLPCNIGVTGHNPHKISFTPIVSSIIFTKLNSFTTTPSPNAIAARSNHSRRGQGRGTTTTISGTRHSPRLLHHAAPAPHGSTVHFATLGGTTALGRGAGGVLSNYYALSTPARALPFTSIGGMTNHEQGNSVFFLSLS